MEWRNSVKNRVSPHNYAIASIPNSIIDVSLGIQNHMTEILFEYLNVKCLRSRKITFGRFDDMEVYLNFIGKTLRYFIWYIFYLLKII